MVEKDMRMIRLSMRGAHCGQRTDKMQFSTITGDYLFSLSCGYFPSKVLVLKLTYLSFNVTTVKQNMFYYLFELNDNF